MPTQFFDIILLAMIAAFIGFRLYSVLGRRTGHEGSPDEQVHVPDARAKTSSPENNVVKLPEHASVGVGQTDPVARGLMEIKLADRSFDQAQFMDGARAAYEMIVTAFGKGDRDTLRPFVSDDVFEAFDSVMAAREKGNEELEVSFPDIPAKITQVELKDRIAEITLTFESDVTEAKYDQTGKPIEGGSVAPSRVTDIWTFARDVGSRDPNWTLVATASG